MMKRAITLCIFTVLMFLNGQTLWAEEPSIRIGAALPLTGEVGLFGIDIQRGMILAQERLASEGIKVDLVVEDTQYLPRLAVTATQKLIERDKVDVIVSLWDTAEAVAPLAERARVPHFSIRWNPRVAEEHSYTFTFESTYQTWITELLRLLQSQGAHRVSLMTDTSGAAWLMARESFLKQAPSYNIRVVKDVEFMGAAADINSAITKLLASPTDYIVMLHYEPTLVNAMKKLQANRVAIPITGYFEGLSDMPFTDGRKFIAQFDTQPWFLELFAKRYPSEKSIKAPFGYDLITILGDLVRKLKRRPTPREIIDYLTNLRNYSGATGTISTNTTRNIETTCVVKEIRNGKAFRPPAPGAY